MRSRIIVVGRDVGLRARLARLLGDGGYRVEIAESAPQACRIGFTDIALAVVAPDGFGPEGRGLVKELRAAIGNVLLVKAPGSRRGPTSDLLDVTDEAGFLARVAEALTPASEPETVEPVLQFAGYRLDLGGHSLVDPTGKEVLLTHGEFGLLRAFAERSGRVLSREQLLQLLAGRDAESYDRSIDMQIVRLRRKIEPDPKRPTLIVTVPNSGYKFAAKVRRVEAVDVAEAVLSAAPPETPPADPERRYVVALAAELLAAEGGSLPGDPEELRTLISTYRHYASTVVARHGGVIAESRGREVLAYFGYPAAQEHAAERAIHAALGLAEHLAEGEAALPAGLAVRVGVASGLVIADPTGEVLGETPGEAARLQHLAEPGQVVIATSTRQVVGDLFSYRELGLLPVKGAATPLQASIVLGPSALSSRSEARYAHALMPLVDREEELNLLLRAWQQARSGEGRLVLLSGEPGIGKSRLLAALEEALAAEPHASLRYFCSPIRRDSPLHPVIARWEQQVGFARADSPDEKLSKLEAVLAPDALPPEDFALVADMLSVPTGGRYPRPELSPQRRKERTFAVLVNRVYSLARTQPLLVLFEDAQWADPSSLELLDTFFGQLIELPILFVISFRADFAAPWIGRAGSSLITLSRLNQRHSATLAAQMTADRTLAHALLDRIVKQTDGVPLFIEELTKAVLESVADVREPAHSLTVPGTLQASLMVRLDRLPAAKQVAQIGAVIGRQFSYALVAATADFPEAQLTQGLADLVASGLASSRGTPPDAIYTFKHALVQDAAYENVLRSRRQVLHQRVAEILRDSFAAAAETEPEILAHHFTQAGLIDAAIDWWGKAGDQALSRFAFQEAISHLVKAIEMADKGSKGVPHAAPAPASAGAAQSRVVPLAVADEVENAAASPQRRLQLQTSLANALLHARGMHSPETQAAFGHARELAGRVDDPLQRFSSYYGVWAGHFVRGELAGMLEIAELVLREAEALAASLEAVVAFRINGATQWFAGNFTVARAFHERALAIFDPQNHRDHAFRFAHDTGVPITAYLSLVAWPLGEVERARTLAGQMVARATETGHVSTIGYGHFHFAVFEMMRRDFAAAAPHIESLVNVSREHEMGMWMAYGKFLAPWSRRGTDGSDAGLAAMRDGIATCRDQGVGLYIPFFKTALAEAEAEAGDFETALATMDDAIDETERRGQRSFEAESYRVRGEILLGYDRANTAPAEQAFLAAITVAQQQKAKSFELRAALSLAKLFEGTRRPADARAILASALTGLSPTREFPEIEQAQTLLGSLPLK